MDYVIDPLEGAGPLKLGMSRDAAQEALADAPQDDVEESDDEGTKDSYYDGVLRVAYDAEDRIASIELKAGGEVRALYRDVDLFEVPAKKAIAALEKDGPHDPEAPEMPFTYIFPSLELALERSDEAEENTFEGLTMGGEGFYSQREVDPEHYGFDGTDRASSDGGWEDDEVDEEEELEEEGFSTDDEASEDEAEGASTNRASSLFGGAGIDDDDDDDFDDLGEQELDFDNPDGLDWSDDDDDDWLGEDDDED